MPKFIVSYNQTITFTTIIEIPNIDWAKDKAELMKFRGELGVNTVTAKKGSEWYDEQPITILNVVPYREEE